MHRLILCLFVVAISAHTGNAALDADALIAVASNFKEAQETLATRFRAKTGLRVESTFSSTGKLYAQIKHGAPYDVFLSADARHVDLLVNDQLAVKPSRFTYAIGRLVLYTNLSKDEPIGESALYDSSIKHIAIANPDLAPYGSAAAQFLKRIGLWERLESKLVQGANIAQAFQYVETQAADCGFVALSQVINRDSSQYYPIPSKLHDPIRQDAVLLACGRDNPAAKSYLEFLKSAEAHAVIREFGYALDGDDAR